MQHWYLLTCSMSDLIGQVCLICHSHYKYVTLSQADYLHTAVTNLNKDRNKINIKSGSGSGRAEVLGSVLEMKTLNQYV